MITIKESIINALKEVNKLLKSKVLNLEHKLSQSKARINSLDQYNQINNLKIQGIPSYFSDDALEDKVTDITSITLIAHDGHDDISSRMIKLCSKSVVKPLSITFKICIDTGTFPDIWKRSNIIPVHKKGDKQIVDNYRPVSLLPIFEKI